MVVRFIVVGFLACVFWLWLAIPTCGCSSREGAYYAAQKSDLKNLASQQEIYYSEYLTYSARPAEMAFTNSDGVIVEIWLHDSGKAWSARTTHVALGGQDGPNAGESCAIYYGHLESVAAVDVPRTNQRDLAPTRPGEIACDYRRPFSVKRAVTDFLFGWL